MHPINCMVHYTVQLAKFGFGEFVLSPEFYSTTFCEKENPKGTKINTYRER